MPPTAPHPAPSRATKQDILRYFLAFLLFFLMVVPYWNRGPVWLSRPDTYTRGMIIKGELEGRSLDANGIAWLYRYSAHELKPVINPFAILFNQYRYRFTPEAFEVVVGAGETPTTEISATPLREFAVYQSGRYVYLRIEPNGTNRVLYAKISGRELEKSLETYIRD
ncbi:MAG: hypothetical protein SH809_19860 [Rhodothermales bacterium]|nr:hypothetical protein [Rhodothermales bacterium]